MSQLQSCSRENIFTEAVSFWPSELRSRGSGDILPRKTFENFIPQTAGNAPKFYKLVHDYIPAVQDNFSIKELGFECGSVVTSNLPNRFQ